MPVAASVDIAKVTEILKDVGREAFLDEDLRPLMLDPPSLMGVESIEVDKFSVRLVARTLPGKQFDVGRELRARIALAFGREGIMVPANLETVSSTGSS